MRMANLIEGLLFMTGFLVVCLVILTERTASRPVHVQLAAVPARRRGLRSI